MASFPVYIVASFPGQVWPYSQDRYGLVPKLGVASFTVQVHVWPCSQARCGLVARPGMVSFPGQVWPHSQTRYGLIPRPGVASFPDQVWSHSQARCGLIPRPAMSPHRHTCTFSFHGYKSMEGPSLGMEHRCNTG